MHKFIASYFDVNSKPGQTKGVVGLSLEEKAKRFSYQYLRIILSDRLEFFLCKVKAAHFNMLTVHQWEREMFRQIDELLAKEKISQDLPSQSQESSQEVRSQQSLERIRGNNDDDNEDEEDGGFFVFYPNMNRTEVRVYAQIDDEGTRTSLLESIKEIIINICKKNNPNFPLYHEMLANKESEKVSANTALNTKDMRAFFKSISKDCYMHGYSNRGTINAQGIGGGGNLPLDKEAAFKLGTVLYDCIPKAWLQPGSTRQLRIYWIGCGFGEEVLTICRLAQKYKYPLFILATDIEQECLDIFQTQVHRHNLTSMIHISKVDVYTTASIVDSFDIVYTSAAIERVFVLKFLNLALTCSTVQYVFCNHTHCVIFDEADNLPREFKTMARDRLVIVDARLEPDNRKAKGEERWIYALDISRYAFKLL